MKTKPSGKEIIVHFLRDNLNKRLSTRGILNLELYGQVKFKVWHNSEYYTRQWRLLKETYLIYRKKGVLVWKYTNELEQKHGLKYTLISEKPHVFRVNKVKK